jgi:hypothetical protein
LRVLNKALLREFHCVRDCEGCGRRVKCCGHHIKPAGMSGGSRMDLRINIVAIGLTEFDCSCHMDFHDGRGQSCEKQKQRFLQAVGKREKCQWQDITPVVNLVWRAPKGSPWEWFLGQLEGEPESVRELMARVWEEIARS